MKRHTKIGIAIFAAVCIIGIGRFAVRVNADSLEAINTKTGEIENNAEVEKQEEKSTDTNTKKVSEEESDFETDKGEVILNENGYTITSGGYGSMTEEEHKQFIKEYEEKMATDRAEEE